jgi:hypothetical protein
VSVETIEARPARKAKPAIEVRAREAICPECGTKVERRSPRGPMPTFCGDVCKRTRSNRRLVRGSAVIELLQAWRIERGSGPIAQRAFAELCSIADLYNAEDRDAGRPRADLMAAKILANGSLFIDRARR